jgi:hypothetical protein
MLFQVGTAKGFYGDRTLPPFAALFPCADTGAFPYSGAINTAVISVAEMIPYLIAAASAAAPGERPAVAVIAGSFRTSPNQAIRSMPRYTATDAHLLANLQNLLEH